MDDAGEFESRAAEALQTLVEAARLGGEIALGFFRHGERTSADIAYKAGDSPVTAADLAVDRKLAQVLRAAFPGAGWLSEETEDDPERLNRAQVIVLDPIDGTRAFMGGDPSGRWPSLGRERPADCGRRACAGARRNLRRLGRPRRDAQRCADPRRALRGACRRAGRRHEGCSRGIRRNFRLSRRSRRRECASLAYRLARVAARTRSRSASRRRIRTTGTSPPPTSSCARRGRVCARARPNSRYNSARIRRDSLIAAPVGNGWRDLRRRIGGTPGMRIASPGPRSNPGSCEHQRQMLPPTNPNSCCISFSAAS